MQVIVDANVLFAALIKKSHTRHLLLNSSWNFYVPEFILSEVYKHLPTLESKTGLSSDELNELVSKLLLAAKIKVIPLVEFKDCLEKARQVSPDPSDAHYFALALKINCVIWSNEKRLKNQSVVRVLNTSELIEMEK